MIGADRYPEVLTIDTEGYDALVLMSAARTLSSGHVGYIEFEYNFVQPWADYHLEYVIDYLDNLQYDCFWATNKGILFRVTGCYDKKYDVHNWSNLVCAHRHHQCWMDALLAHEYQYKV